MPDQDAVLAITAGTPDMQGIMDLAWKYLLPAMQGTSLPPDEEEFAMLQKKLTELELSPVKGDAPGQEEDSQV